jgi:hypothetical protein
MTRLSDRGLSVEVPPSWEARIFAPDLAAPAVNMPVVRMADFHMPPDRSSYGVETAAAMDPRRGGVMLSLVEFGSDLAGAGLYSNHGVPRVHAGDLDRRALQIPRRRQGGVQRFFSVAGRAFVLYVVASIDAGTVERLRTVNDALASLHVTQVMSG